MPASNRSEFQLKGATDSPTAYEFGRFRFEPFNARLMRGDEVVTLTAKALDTLHVLVQHPNTLVSKDELMAAVWPQTIVEENNLSQQIYALRKALADSSSPVSIETVPKRGYRLIGPVTRVAPPPTPFVPQLVSSTTATRGAQPDATSTRRSAWLPVVGIAFVLMAAGAWPLYQRWQIERRSDAAFERGNTLLRQGNGKGAAAEFQEAIQLNGANAEAYAALAQALNLYDTESTSSATRPAGASPSVRAAERAVELDPSCASCRGTLGLFLFYHEWQWAPAEAQFKEAIRLAPEQASIRPSYAMLLQLTGRPTDALAEVNIGLKEKPAQLSWLIIHTSALYYARRYEETIASADQVLLLSRGNRGAWDWRSKALFQLGRGEEGVLALAQSLLAEHSGELDRAVRDGGSAGGLRKALELTDDWRGRIEQSWRRASWRVLLNDKDGALDELERAISARRLNAINLGADPMYDSLRSTPRFRELLRRVGLDGFFPAQ